MQNNIYRSSTNLTRTTTKILNNRTMFKLARQSSINVRLIRSTNHNQVTYREMTVIKAYKLKKNAIKDLANDETGKHTHIVKESCNKTECKAKKCSSLCDKFQDLSVKGHSTYGPVPGKFSKFIAEFNANGIKKRNILLEVTKKKVVDASTKQEYDQNGEFKEDIKQTSYLNSSNDIYDKLDQE